MSNVKINNIQVGQSATATNNFTLYQPATPDGTVRLGVGNAGATSADALTVNSLGNVGIRNNSLSPWSSIYSAVQFGHAGAISYRNDLTATLVQLSNNSYAGASNDLYINTAAASMFRLRSDGGFAWYQAPSGTAGTAITYSVPMVLDAGGNLGIGTSSPVSLLNISGASAPKITITDTRTPTNVVLQAQNGFGWLSVDTNHSLGFATNATERMRIDTSGNVGIGTSSPSSYASKLVINGNISLTTIGQKFYPYYISETNNNYISSAAGGEMIFGTGTSSPAERMRIDTSGNVGIGSNITTTTAASACLFLGLGNSGASYNSTVRLAGYSATAQLRYTFNHAGAGYGWGIGSSGNDAFIIGTVQDGATGQVASEKLRIDSIGNLLVGTTSVGGKFNVVSASAPGGGNYTAYLRNTWATDAGAPGLYIAKYDNNSTTSQILVKFSINNESAGQGQINGNGASQAAFGSFSDARLKENIVDLPPQLENICALRPVEFDYIESEGGGHQISFIAQEFEEVYPDAIGERADGMKTLTGWGKTEARLVKAIQEQQEQINQLKAEVAALKGN